MQKGLEEHMKLSDNFKSKVLLTSWIATLKQFLEETGQDMVFHIYNANKDTKDYILNTWDKYRRELVDDWVTKVTEGIGILPPCCFDLQNLKTSGQAVLNSINTNVWARIENILAHITSGPQVFAAVLEHKQQVNA